MRGFTQSQRCQTAAAARLLVDPFRCGAAALSRVHLVLSCVSGHLHDRAALVKRGEAAVLASPTGALTERLGNSAALANVPTGLGNDINRKHEHREPECLANPVYYPVR